MITAIIPSYNHAHLLPIMLASIINQGPSISRIIVVNDGSTDNTAAVLARIQINEPRLMVKNLTDNVGWMRAQHIGLSYVETDFFSFHAADDFLMPGWAEKSLDALRSAPNIGMCLSRNFVIVESTKLVIKTAIPKKLRGAVLSPINFHRSVMQYGSFMESNGMLIRRSTYDERLVEFSNAGLFADGLTMYMLGLKSGVVLLDEPLSVFFERVESVSGAIIAPRVGVESLKKLSQLLKITPCVEIIDRRLAYRILRRNTYTYLIGSTHHLTSEFLQLTEKTLPPIASRGLQLSLLLLFNLYRLTAFACLRPFDFMIFRESASLEATSDETHAIDEYRKELNYILSSIGLDI